MEVSPVQPGIHAIELNAPLNLTNVPMWLSVVGASRLTSGCLE